MDAAIDRLDGVLRETNLDGVTPAAEPTVLGEIDEELAPYMLPRDLRRFWERVDFETLPVLGSGLSIPLNPDGALADRRMTEEEAPGLYGPPLLFPVARDHSEQTSIELADPWRPGGVVVESGLGVCRLLYPTFTDLVEVYAELVEAGRFELRGLQAWVDRDAEDELQDERWRASGLEGVFGGKREVDLDDPANWPAHWRASAGIVEGDDVPLGTTHTIAELVEASAQAPFAARIAGRIVSLATFGTHTYDVIDDGTASIDVLCPGTVDAWVSRRTQEVDSV